MKNPMIMFILIIVILSGIFGMNWYVYHQKYPKASFTSFIIGGIFNGK